MQQKDKPWRDAGGAQINATRVQLEFSARIIQVKVSVDPFPARARLRSVGLRRVHSVITHLALASLELSRQPHATNLISFPTLWPSS
jgi:hypothetical protein